VIIVDCTPAPEADHPVQSHRKETVLDWIAEQRPHAWAQRRPHRRCGRQLRRKPRDSVGDARKDCPGIDLAAQVLFFPTAE
jgi:hypothetical protein